MSRDSDSTCRPTRSTAAGGRAGCTTTTRRVLDTVTGDVATLASAGRDIAAAVIVEPVWRGGAGGGAEAGTRGRAAGLQRDSDGLEGGGGMQPAGHFNTKSGRCHAHGETPAGPLSGSMSPRQPGPGRARLGDGAGRRRRRRFGPRRHLPLGPGLADTDAADRPSRANVAVIAGGPRRRRRAPAARTPPPLCDKMHN